MDLSPVFKLRKELHQHPELSGSEQKTAARISHFIRGHGETGIIANLGGNGLAAVFDFGEGPTIMIRCELDALPIEEANGFAHKSMHKGISHKCGHDGHMSIVAGLALWINEQSFNKGRIVLLFQPSEENGQGGEAVLKDPRFKKIEPDYVFALHNLPGEEMHSIIVREAVFTATVQSLAIHLKGRQAHASEPENAVNPALALAEITTAFAALNLDDRTDPGFALLTPICFKMGEIAYGISAGNAELHYTLRTWTEEPMQELKQEVLHIVETVCKKHSLQFSTEWFDYFPATVNDKKCVDIIREVAEENNYLLKEIEFPIRFGEDFGWFSKKYPTAMFGLGAGINTPALHHDDYDFPDEISETGIRMFRGIIERLLD